MCWECPLLHWGLILCCEITAGRPTAHLTYALLPESLAIDLIPLDVCMMFKVFNDQRGMRRPQGKGGDSGAYEYFPMKPGSIPIRVAS